MVYRHAIDATIYAFDGLRDLLAKATPPRSGDRLAGVAAESAEQMVAARMALSDVPLGQFLGQRSLWAITNQLKRNPGFISQLACRLDDVSHAMIGDEGAIIYYAHGFAKQPHCQGLPLKTLIIGARWNEAKAFGSY